MGDIMKQLRQKLLPSTKADKEDRQTTGKKYLRTSLGIQWLRIHFPMWWAWV